MTKEWNDRLRDERVARGLSQKDVAERLDTNVFTVNRWEQGKTFPSPHFRQELAKLYGKSLAELGLIRPSSKEIPPQEVPQPPEVAVQDAPGTPPIQGLPSPNTSTPPSSSPLPPSVIREQTSIEYDLPLNSPGSMSGPIDSSPHQRTQFKVWILKYPVLVAIVLVLPLFLTFAFFLSAPRPPTPKANVCQIAGDTSKTDLIASPPTSIGTVAFASSGHFAPNSNQGMNDEVVMDLQGIPPPLRGMSYYGWLSANTNQSEASWYPLGALVYKNGTASLNFSDPQYTNLLAEYSAFLVSEEQVGSSPPQPNYDRSAWKYQASICQIPSPSHPDHYSLLSHLKHLLSADPSLHTLGMEGGLDYWLDSNTQALLAATLQAENAWHHHNTLSLRTQLATVLAYLDGNTYISRDIAHPLILPDTSLVTRVGLLYGAAQNQSLGYLAHIDIHLRGVSGSLGASVSQQQLASQLYSAIGEVSNWLGRVREDAHSLIMLSDKQLFRLATLSQLQQQEEQAHDAFYGQTPSPSNVSQGGVQQIYMRMQQLATFELLSS
jgi:transcriptional regulator with XRE-family HTH domain